MNFLNYLNQKQYKLQLERLVIGVEEPIFIKTLGTVLAKADSGNGCYNVLHGEDFYKQGDVLIFTAFDENEKPHRISKKIQDNITINIGAGHTEDRPVVLFDVKFANDEYLNVPFTIGNRSNNKNKVLLGKDFLTKELNALIDISSDDIASKNIQVDIPIEEASNASATGSNHFIPTPKSLNPSGAASTTKKIYQGVKGGIRGGWNIAKALTDPGATIGTAIDGVKSSWKQMVDEINDYQESDKFLIFKALNEKFMESGQPIKPFINNPQIIKILDYQGQNFAEKPVDSTVYPDSIETNENPSDNPNQPNNNTKALSNTPQLGNRLELGNTPQLGNIPQLGNRLELGNKSQNENVETNLENSNNTLLNEIDNLKDNSKAFNKASEDANKKNKPILYLVIFDGSNLDKVRAILIEKYPQFNGYLKDIMRNISSDFSIETTDTLATEIVRTLNEESILSDFALVSGLKKDRKVKFLASAFRPSQLTLFLGQYTKNYVHELLNGFEGSINQNFKAGRFLNNPIFGFVQYKRGTNNRTNTGLPDNQIKEWIFDPDAHSGYNVKAAFNKFIGQKSEYVKPVIIPGDEQDNISQPDGKAPKAPKGPRPRKFTRAPKTDNPEDFTNPFDENGSLGPKPKPKGPKGPKGGAGKAANINPDAIVTGEGPNIDGLNPEITPDGNLRIGKENPFNKIKFPIKAPKDFKMPSKHKKLNNGKYLWQSKSGRYILFDPKTNILDDALEANRRTPTKEEQAKFKTQPKTTPKLAPKSKRQKAYDQNISTSIPKKVNTVTSGEPKSKEQQKLDDILKDAGPVDISSLPKPMKKRKPAFIQPVRPSEVFKAPKEPEPQAINVPTKKTVEPIKPIKAQKVQDNGELEDQRLKDILKDAEPIDISDLPKPMKKKKTSVQPIRPSEVFKAPEEPKVEPIEVPKEPKLEPEEILDLPKPKKKKKTSSVKPIKPSEVFKAPEEPKVEPTKPTKKEPKKKPIPVIKKKVKPVKKPKIEKAPDENEMFPELSDKDIDIDDDIRSILASPNLDADVDDLLNYFNYKGLLDKKKKIGKGNEEDEEELNSSSMSEFVRSCLR